jgi:Glycosyltransferase family 87
MTQGPVTKASDPATAQVPRLAEPPIPGGRVEAMMGVLIRALKSSPLARPLPAVSLSVLGLGMLAFTGLCATAPGASEAALPVFLPLTALARRLGAPVLSADVTNAIMYPAITFCCLGLAGMLWANSRGWQPNPRRVFWSAVVTVAVVVNITPVGSSDPASLAAYGRIAALGHNPYVFLPIDLPGGVRNPYVALVDPRWRTAPSVYGPVATWTHLAAALVGGSKPWLTIWALMIMTGAAYLAAGYLLLRSAADPVRAGLIWAANPLLIYVLIMGGQLDAFVALAGIAAILISRRGATVWHDLATGVLIGIAMGIKINAAFVALGIAVPLIRERQWARLFRTAAVAAVVTFGLYFFSYGVTALRPLPEASGRVISPSFWRLFQILGDHVAAPATVNMLIAVQWPLLLILLAWYLYNRLSPDVPAVLAATCALTFAWVLVAPWSLPWYTAVAWVTLALLPRNSLTRWLALATLVPALLHFSAGQPDNHPGGPAPTP